MRECVICGSTEGTTREHAPLSEWISRFLLSDRTPGTEFLTSFKWTGFPDETAGRRVGKIIPMRDSILCDPCNSHWMSDLDTSASELMKPLIRGQSRRLPPARQQTIDRWVIAKVMAAEFVDIGRSPRPSFFTTEQRRAFHSSYVVPPHVRVWLGDFRGPHAAAAITIPFRGSGPGTEDVRGLVGFIIAARLLIAFYARRPTQPDDSIEPTMDEASLVPIWPATQLRSWPPPRGMSRQDVEATLEHILTDPYHQPFLNAEPPTHGP